MTKKSQEIADSKLPPHDIEIESAVLGAIMLEKDTFATVNGLVVAEVFYRPANRLIFDSMVSLFDKNESIDLLTVKKELDLRGTMSQVGGAFELTKLTNNVVSSANIELHCRILLELYLKREAARIAMDMYKSSFDKTADVFDTLNRADNEIINSQERVMKGSVKDSTYYATKVYEEYENTKATGILGIETGIRPFDKIMCGLVAPDLVIIAARPGQGKTGFAISITKNISFDRNIPCVWFSYEMSGVQLTRRLASQVSGVSHQEIRQGAIYNQKEVNFLNAIDKISKAPIFIYDDNSINIRDLRTKAILLKRKHNIGFIVVDYLQLMPPVDVKNKNREQQVSDISRGLKSLAKEINTPIVALSQLSRSVEARSDKMPQLADLRESGAIEQDADNVLFLMRPEYYGMMESVTIKNTEYDAKGLCIGINGKNRHGATSNFAMQFDGPTMTIGTHPNDTFVEVQKINTTLHNKSEPSDVNEEDWGDQPF